MQAPEKGTGAAQTEHGIPACQAVCVTVCLVQSNAGTLPGRPAAESYLLPRMTARLALRLEQGSTLWAMQCGTWPDDQRSSEHLSISASFAINLQSVRMMHVTLQKRLLITRDSPQRPLTSTHFRNALACCQHQQRCVLGTAHEAVLSVLRYTTAGHVPPLRSANGFNLPHPSMACRQVKPFGSRRKSQVSNPPAAARPCNILPLNANNSNDSVGRRQLKDHLH